MAGDPDVILSRPPVILDLKVPAREEVPFAHITPLDLDHHVRGCAVFVRHCAKGGRLKHQCRPGGQRQDRKGDG